MTIPYLNLQQLNASFDPQLSEAVRQIVGSGQYLRGEATHRFEQQFARYCGAARCIGVANGLDALTLIFLAYREMGTLHAGDEVIVPAHTYIATLLAVLRAGLKPVLCEPRFDTCNIDPEAAERLVTSHTRAILPVHLYGRPADMNALNQLADRHKLLVVEDAAQAHGSRPLTGAAAAYSFYPAKNLGALGDGGAVVTHDIRLADTVRSLANYGSSDKYTFIYKGVNSRLDEVQAAVLSVKLLRLDPDNERRRAIARRYLKEIPWERVGITAPVTVTGIEPDNVFHVFPVFTPHRDELQQHLLRQGIGTQIHYPIPPHRQPALSAMYGELHLPITERIHAEELSLPISPLLSEEEVTNVIEAIACAPF
ncbi:MAG: DegT/DnrJ/EryC1/StrS family aminotransferase [Prevotellaceae bacterium]|jgi:dTDP-4-amino-4,6-dideoxygalactose transaminase|nr:DegT/DnrJ/EryC1/StrS family aminotransferase [Prevotellaceae bacterium]